MVSPFKELPHDILFEVTELSYKMALAVSLSYKSKLFNRRVNDALEPV